MRPIWLLALLSPSLLAATCDSLKSLSLPGASITSAATIAPGAFTLPAGTRGPAPSFADLPEFCRVQATLRPSPDSDIKIEVWMPVRTAWDGKFEGIGNGAYAGTIGYVALSDALRHRYAAANTDTGHAQNSGSFALGHPEKVIDFGYRAVHEMSVKAKAIVAAYYGQPAKFSYWNGCSTGGRQALQEAQKYPDDYDGIIAGAPANNTTRMTMQQLSVNQATLRNKAVNLPAAKFKAIHEAVIAACDGKDGVKDGVLENPTKCQFDPRSIACNGADSDSCLTDAQVAAVRRVYSNVTNPGSGEYIFPGFERGSELGWSMVIGPRPFGYADDFWRYMVMKDPSWDFQRLNYETDLAKALKEDHGIIDATDPNLSPFFKRGGKLLQYHGWNDPGIAPRNSVDYYTKVVDTLGGVTKIRNSYRLFMVPGMAHCRGGEGTDTFDVLAALERWVEQGKAPDSIPAARVVNGKTVRTRPLCPYPQEAVYKGGGSTNDANNFSCKVR